MCWGGPLANIGHLKRGRKRPAEMSQKCNVFADRDYASESRCITRIGTWYCFPKTARPMALNIRHTLPASSLRIFAFTHHSPAGNSRRCPTRMRLVSLYNVKRRDTGSTTRSVSPLSRTTCLGDSCEFSRSTSLPSESPHGTRDGIYKCQVVVPGLHEGQSPGGQLDDVIHPRHVIYQHLLGRPGFIRGKVPKRLGTFRATNKDQGRNQPGTYQDVSQVLRPFGALPPSTPSSSPIIPEARGPPAAAATPHRWAPSHSPRPR